MYEVERHQSVGGDLRRETCPYRGAQSPTAPHRPAGFDQGAGEVLGQYAAEIFPFVDFRARDAGLQVLAVVVVVIPDTGWLVKATQPDDRVAGELPAELKAFEIAFVIRYQVFPEYLEGPVLQTENHVSLQNFIDYVGDRRLTVESSHRLRAWQEQELMLERVCKGQWWAQQQ